MSKEQLNAILTCIIRYILGYDCYSIDPARRNAGDWRYAHDSPERDAPDGHSGGCGKGERPPYLLVTQIFCFLTYMTVYVHKSVLIVDREMKI